MTPVFFGGVDGPEMYELLSGFVCVCENSLVKGDGVSVLMGHMYCLLHMYLLPSASMWYDLEVLAGLIMVPS